jgi:hypothetical protein
MTVPETASGLQNYQFMDNRFNVSKGNRQNGFEP